MNKIFFYYIKDENNNKIGCVAVNENEDGTINRGVSICSKVDKFNKTKARGIAYSRLINVCNTKTNVTFNEYTGDTSKILFPKIPEIYEIVFKEHYHVTPSAKEFRMLHKPNFD